LQLSVIIVNYNVKYFLEQCLVSVINACKNINAEIIVVDNCSKDDSKTFFNNRFEKVQFIWNSENVGFAAANNIALKRAKGGIILFLNPDTILPHDCLEKTIQFLKSQPTIGATGIRMIDGSGSYLKESKRGFPSPATSLSKLTGLAKVFPTSKFFARYYLGHLSEDESCEVDVLSGAFMMVNKNVLDITGSFDEVFFMYGEDIDLSYRIQKAGFQNFYFAESTIIHFKGESTSKHTAQYIRNFYGAMELFVKKHYTQTNAFIYSSLIDMVILSKYFTSAAALLIKNKKLNGKATKAIAPSSLNTVIVANIDEYIFIEQKLKAAGTSYNILGRVALFEKSADALGILSQLPLIVYKHQLKHIVFCADEKSINKIIEIIETLPPLADYSFHLPNTIGVVGSNNKNEAGFYFQI